VPVGPGAEPARVSPGPEGEREPSVVLYVHALSMSDADAVRADGRQFERLAVAAFGSPADRARMKEATS